MEEICIHNPAVVHDILHDYIHALFYSDKDQVLLIVHILGKKNVFSDNRPALLHECPSDS